MNSSSVTMGATLDCGGVELGGASCGPLTIKLACSKLDGRAAEREAH